MFEPGFVSGAFPHELPVCLQAKDSDDDEEVVQVDRDHFMDEFFEQVRYDSQSWRKQTHSF